jgi:chromosome partitioning protein
VSGGAGGDAQVAPPVGTVRRQSRPAEDASKGTRQARTSKDKKQPRRKQTVGTDASGGSAPLHPSRETRKKRPPSTARDAAASGTTASAPAAVGTARVIAIANQKGGVGKSTTAVNLGACLAEAGRRVLVIDLDPQGNASTGVGIGHSDREVTIYEVLTAGSDMRGAVLETDVPGLAVVPSTIDLAGAEIELVSQFSREARLARALGSVRPEYDFILLDCPPSLGLLTVNALTAADELIVPIQCEYYALEGLGQLLKNVRLVQQNVNPRLRLTGIVMTMFDSRTKLADQVVAEVRAYFGPRVYDSIIPRSVRLAEAPGFGKTILQYDPGSKGAKAYRHLAEELLNKAAGDGLGDLDLTDLGQGVAVQETPVEETPVEAPAVGANAAGFGPGTPAMESDEDVAEPEDDRGSLDEEPWPDPAGADILTEDEKAPEPHGDAGSEEANEAGTVGIASVAPAAEEQPLSDEQPTADAGAPGPSPEGSGTAPDSDQRPKPAPEGTDTGSWQETQGEDGGTPASPRVATAETSVPQAFSQTQRLVHIVPDEWEGLGIGPEEDLPRDEPGPGGRGSHPSEDEPTGEGDQAPASTQEQHVGKLRRWLFGKTKGGDA